MGPGGSSVEVRSDDTRMDDRKRWEIRLGKLNLLKTVEKSQEIECERNPSKLILTPAS